MQGGGKHKSERMDRSARAGRRGSKPDDAKPNGDGRADGLRGAEAAEAAGEEPLPLRPEVMPPAPYPVRALGPLAAVTQAVSGTVVVDPAIAAGSVLATASLAVMCHYNVLAPYGRRIPTAIYNLTIASSGERKTACDDIAKEGIRDREAELSDRYRLEKGTYAAKKAVWERQLKRILGDQKMTAQQKSIAIQGLGAEPSKPIKAILQSSDATMEGVIRHWPSLPPIHGLFSSEGGLVISGAKMRDELVMSSIATLSRLWDGGDYVRMRAGDEEPIELRGRRLAMHAMIQPVYAPAFLGNQRIKGQGLPARVLPAWPASKIGSRPFHRPDPANIAETTRFSGRVLALLRKDVRVDERGTLAPHDLRLSPKARTVWIRFHDAVDAAIRVRYETIQETASKTAEHALRIAAVLEAFGTKDPKFVSAASMLGGIELALWYLEEALRIQGLLFGDAELDDAQALLDWLLSHPGRRTFRAVLQFAPERFRFKAKAGRLLGIIEDHRWIAWREDGKKSFDVFGDP